MSELKRMSVKEFRKLGLLQEVNRRVLHPCGLALEVLVNDDTGDVSFGQVWDFRDDPEGLIYRDEDLDINKKLTVDGMLTAKEATRLEQLGYVIQPVEK